MSILSDDLVTLEELAAGQISGLEEFDLLTGQFHPVNGKNIQPVARPESVEVKLHPRMVVARATFVPTSKSERRTLAQSLAILYQRNWSGRLLSATLKPIDIDVDSYRYYHEVTARILNAMSARYVIMRLIVEKSDGLFLKCVAMEDRRSLMPADKLETYDIKEDDENAKIYVGVVDAFQNRRKYMRFVRREKDPAVFKSMTSINGTGDIETILIAALTMGNKVRGFINVGYDVRVALNEHMLSVFATTFNHMCIAIETHNSMNEISDMRRAQLNEWIQRSNLEFIQGFRHSAQNALMSADIARERMLAHYTYKGDASVDPARSLESAHREIEAAFDRMASLKGLSEAKSRVDMRTVFDEAKELLSFQITQSEADVRVHNFPSHDMDAVVNARAIRDAFANLILNSLEAFQQANTRRTDRKITVSFRKDHGTIYIDFGDEGPGVRLGKNIRQYSDIWLPERTTKVKGTGYGLPFVRRVFQDVHKGHVELRPSNKGTLFRINFPDGL